MLDVGDNDFEYDITENELDDIIFNAAITDEEIIKAVKSLKRSKSSDQDEFISEYFIYSIELILLLLIKLFNRILDTGNFPTWGLSIFVTCFKKGNVNNPSDYRGISLLDVIGENIYSHSNQMDNIFH